MLKPYAEQAAEAQKIIENLERCGNASYADCKSCPYGPRNCDNLLIEAADLLRAAYNKKGRNL